MTAWCSPGGWLRWARAALLWLAGLLLAAGAGADTLELTQAHATVTVNGITTAQAIQLPYHWDRYNRGERGEAVFEIPFNLPEVPAEPWGLFFPRVGNAYEVRLNGALLQRQGDLRNFNGADYSQVPRFVAIPEGLLRTANVFQVRIRADVGRRGGLSQLVVGPQEDVYAAYLSSFHWRGTATMVVAAFSLLVGLLALALWATQLGIDASGSARRDPLYLYAALAEFAWAFGVGYAVLEKPPLAWPWWGVLPVVGVTLWTCFMALFCLEVAQWGRHPGARWFRRWLVILMAGSLVLPVWALAWGQPLALTLLYAAMAGTNLVFVAMFMWQAGHRAPGAQRLVALAFLINVAAGVRDLYVYRVNPTYGEITWIRFTSVLFGLTLAWIVVQRFRAATAQVRKFSVTLAERVAQKERELDSSYQRLELLARDQERTSERSRILRDMHDGVGSHISSAIRQLQSGKASQVELMQTLRDSLDHLKLTVDSMHLPQGDITALLANMRYRLEPRFAASDIELQWDVDLLRPVARLDGRGMQHVQFMVFEALSNVLQHAQASVLRIEAVMTPQGVQLRIIDNGRGFDVNAPARKGLNSMRERAAAVGATLNLYSAPGRTSVEILIP